MMSESIIDASSEALGRAVLQGDAAAARQHHRSLWAQGGGLHQAMAPLLMPCLCAVDPSPGETGALASGFLAMAELSPHLPTAVAAFAASRFLEVVLASARLPLTLEGRCVPGALSFARGASREPLEGYLRAARDGQWRRALYYGVLVADDNPGAVAGVSLELVSLHLDALGGKLVAQVAFSRLFEATEARADARAALVALSVENLLIPGHPTIPEPLAAPRSSPADIALQLVERGGPQCEGVALAAAAFDASGRLEVELAGHVWAQAEWIADRLPPADGVRAALGEGSSVLGLDGAFSSGPGGKASDAEAEHVVSCFLGARGVTDGLLARLASYALACDIRPAQSRPLSLVQSVAALAKSEREGIAAKGTASSAALQVWRHLRTLHRQWGTVVAPEGHSEPKLEFRHSSYCGER